MTLAARVPLLLSFCSVLVVLFIHNPFDGWKYDYLVAHDPSIPCGAHEKNQWKEAYAFLLRNSPQTEEKERQIQEYADKCQRSGGHYEKLPFAEWKSENPLLLWFGPVKNVLIACGLAFLISAAIYLTFRSQKNKDALP